MWELIIKKAERWRIDAFELWCRRRLLSVPWTVSRYYSVLIWRTDVETETPILWPPDAKNQLLGKKLWCWERLKAGGEGDNRGRDDWMASRTQWIWVWVGFRSWWWTGKPGVLQSMWLQSWTWLSDWTEPTWSFYKYFIMYIQLTRCMES